MKNIISAGFSLMLLGSLVIGCGNAVEVSPAQANASEVCARNDRAGHQEYVFSAGSAQVSRVTRSTRDDGAETLSGVTKSSRGTLTEYAEINAAGRLVYADASFVGKNGLERHVLVDAAHGVFYVQDARGAVWHSLSTDAPWVIAGLTGAEGSFMLDRAPVSAWIAARAASLSTNLQVIDVQLRQGVLAATDQFVVEGDVGERLVLTASTAISVNDEFVTNMGEERDFEPTRLAIDVPRPRRTAQR